MKSAPMVSVIIATLGERKSFKRAVDSVLSQSYENWELIIICKEELILQKYQIEKNHKMRVIKEVESGIYQNFNLGIVSANGSLLAILNDDDWYETNFLELAVNDILNSNCDGVYGNSIIHSEKGKKLVEAGEELTRNLLFDFLDAYHTTILLKKECFYRYGLFQYKTSTGYPLNLANDYLWFSSALQRGLNLKKNKLILGNFTLGGESSQHRISLIREARNIGLANSKNGIEKIKVYLVWESRLAFNVLKYFAP